MKKVIVTGANGFIGSSLINKLVRNQIEVIAIDISFSNLSITENKLVTRIEMNLEDVDEMINKVPEGEYDAFYHFAWRGVNGTEKANPDVQIKNISMMINCASFAKKIECKKFLCAGTIAEESIYSLENLNTTNGGMLYGVAKHCAHLMLETYCKNIELDFIWMQFSNIYGPENKTGNLVSYTINELKSDRKACFGPANQPYDFIFVDDLIEAIYRLGSISNLKNQYFIGSGTPKILKEYLFEIGKIFGREDLIKIGIREDDGIRYSMDMFNISSLKSEIGDYVSETFSERISYTIENF